MNIGSGYIKSGLCIIKGCLRRRVAIGESSRARQRLASSILCSLGTRNLRLSLCDGGCHLIGFDFEETVASFDSRTLFKGFFLKKARDARLNVNGFNGLNLPIKPQWCSRRRFLNCLGDDWRRR
ncbi:hypothetical protein D9M69_616370 [compost metagenome]